MVLVLSVDVSYGLDKLLRVLQLHLQVVLAVHEMTNQADQLKHLLVLRFSYHDL